MTSERQERKIAYRIPSTPVGGLCTECNSRKVVQEHTFTAPDLHISELQGKRKLRRAQSVGAGIDGMTVTMSPQGLSRN